MLVREGDNRGAASGRRSGYPVPWGTVAGLVLYLALAVVVFGHAWVEGVTTHLQPGADQASTVWFLRWIPTALGHGENPFVTSYGNYPFGVNVLTNTGVPLLGLVAAPVTELFGPVASYNTLLTLAPAASAAAAYAFCRTWVSWRPAAWVGGLVYGFSPYVIAQSAAGHLNLTFVALPPLILLAGRRLLVGEGRGSIASGVVLGLLVVAQFFVSSEVLASTLVMAAVCGVGAWITGGRAARRRWRPGVRSVAAAGVTTAVLLGYPLWLVVAGPDHIAGPIQLVPQAYRADLLGPLLPGVHQWLAPTALAKVAADFAGSPAENGSYLGVTLLVTLAVMTVGLWRRLPVVRVAAVAGAAAFVISLGGALVVRGRPGAYPTGLPLPERLLTRLPLLSNTVPVRYSAYVALFAGLVLACGLDTLWTRRVASPAGPGGEPPAWARSPVGATVLCGAVAVVCLVPLVPRVPLGGFAAAGTPAYFSSPGFAAVPRGQVDLLYPFPTSAVPQGQLDQAVAGLRFKTPGGYFLVPEGPLHHIAFSTTGLYGADTLTARVLSDLYNQDPPAETPALRAALLAQLRSWHIATTIATPAGDPDPARSRQFLTWLMGAPPVRDSDVLLWRLPPARAAS